MNGNARESVGALAFSSKWTIKGFIDDNPAKQGTSFAGITCMGRGEQLALDPTAHVLAVPGRAENYTQRSTVIASLGVSETLFATVIHPSSSIRPEVSIVFNTLIMAGVVITAGVKIGNHVVILPNTVISHDVVIEDYCMIGSNVSISGGVHLRENCYVGSGARIISDVQIGARALIGLGTVVIRDIPSQTVNAGNPSRLLRTF